MFRLNTLAGWFQVSGGHMHVPGGCLSHPMEQQGNLPYSVYASFAGTEASPVISCTAFINNCLRYSYWPVGGDHVDMLPYSLCVTACATTL